MIKMFGIKNKIIQELKNTINKLEEELKNEKSFIKKLYKSYNLYKEKYIKEPKFLVMNTDYYLLLRKEDFFYDNCDYCLDIEYILGMEIVIDDNIIGWYIK